MSVLGGDWTDEDQALCLGGPLERVADHMIARSGTTRTAEEIGVMLLDAMEHRLRTTPLAWRPGARELLVECRDAGLPTALVSASWSRLIVAVGEKIREDLGRDPFDAIVAGDDVEYSKPHPDPYLTAAAALGSEPADCLALEDSPTGVRSAVAAGCRVVAIPHLAPVTDDGALVISTLEGITLRELWRRACAPAACR
jgi:HAD superfamily hydrolase (TIGR01509 family)